MEQSVETNPELKDGDKFYVKKGCKVIGRQQTVPVDVSDVIEAVQVASASFRSHLIRIKKKADGSTTEAFFISQENFNDLLKDIENREGPISPENPLSLKRAKQLLQEGPCAMREEPASESAVRDLMLAARARVLAEGPRVTLSGEEKAALNAPTEEGAEAPESDLDISLEEEHPDHQSRMRARND